MGVQVSNEPCNEPVMRFHWSRNNEPEVFGLSFTADTLVSDIQVVIEARTGVAVAEQRLIFGGRELDASKTLEELNIHPKEMLYLLPRLPHVCREWAATGFCSRGRRCYQKATHTVEFSPRYVEHHAKISSPAVPSVPGPSCAAGSDTVMPLTDPMQPQPPAYSKLGTTRPTYGPLSRAVQSGARREAWLTTSQKNVRVKAPQQSNSGDWDGIVSDITSVMQGEDVATVEENIEIDEKSWAERSWEEAAVVATIAPMGFGAKYEYDSAYESSTASLAGEMEEYGSATVTWPTGCVLADGPGSADAIRYVAAAGEQVPCETHRKTDMAGDVAEATAGVDRRSCDVDKNAAGLEFSAGVHLIDEMENQVKQWEEDESMREKAYSVWVSQQMARAVTIVTSPKATHGSACGQKQIRVF